jgi:hypothetical protein
VETVTIRSFTPFDVETEARRAVDLFAERNNSYDSGVAGSFVREIIPKGVPTRVGEF